MHFRVLLYLWAPFFTNAFYFYLDEGTEKCFTRELAGETLLVANYRCSSETKRNGEDQSKINDHGVMVEIRDPHQKIVLSRLYRSEGRFSYKSDKPGVHTICLDSKEKPSKNKIKIDFNLQVGEHAINKSESMKRKGLTDIGATYQKLVEKANEITKEMDYLRYREEMFRGTTENINQIVLLWMVGETILLVIIAVWQVEKLRTFFESKKLV